MKDEEDLKGIDERIKKEYELLIAREYLPIVTNVINEKAALLRDNGISFIELNYSSRAFLTFFDNGVICDGKREISLGKKPEDNIRGLINLGQIYQKLDYSHDFTIALKMFLDNLEMRVKEVVMTSKK